MDNFSHLNHSYKDISRQQAEHCRQSQSKVSEVANVRHDDQGLHALTRPAAPFWSFCGITGFVFERGRRILFWGALEGLTVVGGGPEVSLLACTDAVPSFGHTLKDWGKVTGIAQASLSVQWFASSSCIAPELGLLNADRFFARMRLITVGAGIVGLILAVHSFDSHWQSCYFARSNPKSFQNATSMLFGTLDQPGARSHVFKACGNTATTRDAPRMTSAASLQLALPFPSAHHGSLKLSLHPCAITRHCQPRGHVQI